MPDTNDKREIFSFSNFGYEGAIIKVETDLRRGIPAYDIVGLSDGDVKAARERVIAAFKNSNLDFPQERILLSLSPADIKKEGTSFDLAMALGILNEQTNYKGDNVLVMGELELSGNVKPVKAVRAAIENAKAAGITNVIVPKQNLQEALEIPGVKVLAVDSLADAHTKLLNNEKFIEKTPDKEFFSKKVEFNEEALSEALDTDLTGHYETARAIEVAIAGKHNILLTGAPGSGKTYLSQRLFPALTPNLTYEESQSTTRIWSIAGLMKPEEGIKKEVPFRMPHQTASVEGMLGGGVRILPGETSLAHNGVLFLDEAAEFRASVLQMMRVPLDNKSVTLSRAGRSTVYPANCQLVMATNPCPCGNNGSGSKICLCSAKAIEMYWEKLSKPLLDRVEIKNFVEKNENDSRKITVEEMKQHIENAIRIQRENPHYNASLTPEEISELCKLDENSSKYLESKTKEKSPRERGNILKVALTIANMDNRKEIQLEDLQESVELTAPVFEKLQEYKREPDKKKSLQLDEFQDYSISEEAFEKLQEENNPPQKMQLDPLTVPTKVIVNGKERECKNGIFAGFVNAVQQLDTLTENYNELVENYNTLKEQINTKSFPQIRNSNTFER